MLGVILCYCQRWRGGGNDVIVSIGVVAALVTDFHLQGEILGHYLHS